jgi:DNA polymerase III subunit epsilon
VEPFARLRSSVRKRTTKRRRILSATAAEDAAPHWCYSSRMTVELERTREIILKRPISFFDLETTGTSFDVDRIIELAVLKIEPGGQMHRFESRIDPEIKIPIEATRVHGITDADVQGKPKFLEIAPRLLELIDGSDLGGFNVARFDVPFLEQEFKRAGIDFQLAKHQVVDVMAIYHSKEPRNLTAAVRFYCHAAHEEAHSAFADARAAWKILNAQLQLYDDLPNDVAQLAAFAGVPTAFLDSGRKFEERHGEPSFAFGKYRGQTLNKIAQEDPDYLQWMLTGMDPHPPADTQEIIKVALHLGKG